MGLKAGWKSKEVVLILNYHGVMQLLIQYIYCNSILRHDEFFHTTTAFCVYTIHEFFINRSLGDSGL